VVKVNDGKCEISHFKNCMGCGTVSFNNKNLVKVTPKLWKEVLNGE
jgi:hypothetical protein